MIKLLLRTVFPLLTFALIAGVVNAQTIRFDIPAQPLETALAAFGEQSGLQVSADAALTASQKAKSVQGEFTPADALQALLEGTGLSYRFLRDNTVMLVEEPNQSSEITLGTIIVTGERVERSLLDTKTSVRVIREDELQRASPTSVYDLANRVSNVTPVSGDFLPPIRGVNSDGPLGIAGNDLNGTSPRLNIIVDGVSRPISYPNNSFQSVFDAEQVEILRGPQTALQGANAIAGAFVINTKNPVFDREGNLSFILEDDDFSDPTKRAGLMYNDVLVKDELAYRMVLEYTDGQVPIADNSLLGFGDPQKDEDLASGRLKLLWEPAGTPALSALFSVEYQDGRDPAFDSSVVNKARQGGSQRVLDTRSAGAAADIRYQLRGGELRSITSYFSDRYESNPDSTEVSVNFDSVKDERFTQDLTYTFENAGAISSGLVGLTYRYQENDQRYGNLLDRHRDGERNTAAAFANLNFELSARWELTAGGRLHYETYEEVTNNSFSGSPVVVLNYDETYTEFLPTLGLTYMISDAHRVFVSGRQGFNSGGSGINLFTGVPFTFDPEYVNTYEVGYRGELADGDLILTITAFYNDYDGYHTYVFGPGGPVDYSIVNLDGNTYGIEFEGRARLSDELEASFGLGLLETEIDESGEAFDGNGFGDDPDVTLNVGVVWEARPGLTFDAQAAYIGEYFADFNENPGTESGEYWNLDLGISFEWDSLRVRGFVRNVFDEVQYVNLANAAGAGTVLDPRTIGMNLSYAF